MPATPGSVKVVSTHGDVSQPMTASAEMSDRALLRSTSLISALTMVSRVGGLLRDMAIAYVFGASGVADAFFIAFKIPNFFRRLFAEGAFSAGFVPVLATFRVNNSQEDVRNLIAHISGALGTVLLVITLLGIAGSHWLALLFAPGFARDPLRLHLTAELLALTFPYLLFISLTALAGGVLNSYRRFGIPAVTPVLLNVCLIAATLGLAPLLSEPVTALGWGVLLAGIAQLALQVPALRRLNLLPRPRLNWRHPGVKQVLVLMVPALFGASVAQINLLVDTWIASFLQPRSVSWLYYADRLMELPVGVLAVGVATVSLPLLSSQHAANKPQDFARTLDWGLRVGALVTIPAAVALYVLAEPIIATIFGHGAFTALDGAMASLALQAYTTGLPGFVGVKLLAPGYFARHDTRTPVRIAVICVLVNVLLNLALMNYMGHVGLALSTGAAALLNAFLLWRGLVRCGVYQAGPQWRRDLTAIVCGCAAMCMVLWLVPQMLSHVFQQGTNWLQMSHWARAWHLAVSCVLGGAAYAATLFAFGVRPATLRAPPRL